MEMRRTYDSFWIVIILDVKQRRPPRVVTVYGNVKQRMPQRAIAVSNKKSCRDENCCCHDWRQANVSMEIKHQNIYSAVPVNRLGLIEKHENNRKAAAFTVCVTLSKESTKRAIHWERRMYRRRMVQWISTSKNILWTTAKMLEFSLVFYIQLKSILPRQYTENCTTASVRPERVYDRRRPTVLIRHEFHSNNR